MILTTIPYDFHHSPQHHSLGAETPLLGAQVAYLPEWRYEGLGRGDQFALQWEISDRGSMFGRE